MPYSCSIINCQGNFKNEPQCRVFLLPSDQTERQMQLDVIPKANQERTIGSSWYSEKIKKLTFDGKVIGSFTDVQQEREKDNIFKCTPLNSSAIYPTRLQLQNVKHVLNVFNNRVIAALQLDGKVETAAFMQDVLSQWFASMNGIQKLS